MLLFAAALRLLFDNTLLLVVLLGKLLISQEFRVHASCGKKSLLLGLLDPVGVSLVGFVVCASVLLLLLVKEGETRVSIKGSWPSIALHPKVQYSVHLSSPSSSWSVLTFTILTQHTSNRYVPQGLAVKGVGVGCCKRSPGLPVLLTAFASGRRTTKRVNGKR